MIEGLVIFCVIIVMGLFALIGNYCMIVRSERKVNRVIRQYRSEMG